MWVKVVWAGMGLSGGFLSVSGYVIYFARRRGRRKGKIRPAVMRAAAAPAGEGAEAELVSVG
jgi:hypothetical protein